MLITQTVVNHSLSKPDVLIKLPIQVAYSTDLEVAKELMINIAKAHPRVVAEGSESPKVFLNSFGENGITLDLVIWIKDAEDGQLNLRSDIHWEIWRVFSKHAIEFPFPQRVVRVISDPPA